MLNPPDKILVIDIEATCWKNNKIPKGQQNEIIEVGICVLDTKMHVRIASDTIIVKPYSYVSEFCTELTTLTQADVDKGISLREACDILQTQYLSRKCLWASYGAYDKKIFQKECHQKGIEYPFYPQHLNVKQMFADTFNLKRQVGMAGALKRLDFPLEGTHHRGVDDAWNIAKILAYLLQQ